MGSLLREAAEFFKSRGVSIKRWVKDDQGKIAFYVFLEGAEGHSQLFIVAAKKAYYHDDGQSWASFMRQILERAVDRDALAILFVKRQKTNNFRVFDPAAILEYGYADVGEDQRHTRGEEWLDIPKEWGVPMEDYMARVSQAPREEPTAEDPPEVRVSGDVTATEGQRDLSAFEGGGSE